MSFGENLIALRTERGIGRKDLANMLGIPYTTLRNYETDQREPGHKLLVQLAQMFSVSVDSLIGVSMQDRSSTLSDDALKLAQSYDSLNEDGKQRICDAIKRELEIKDSLDKLMKSVRVLRIYDYHLDVLRMEESGIDLNHDKPTDSPFSIPENPPKSQKEVLEKLKNKELSQPIGVQIYLDGFQDKVFVVDLGTPVSNGQMGLYNFRGRSYLAKIKSGKFYLYPYNHDPLPYAEISKCEGAVVGQISTKIIYG